MLPIVGTSSALILTTRGRAAAPGQPIGADPEPLSGQWQGAHRQGKKHSGHTLDGELYSDLKAVADYMAAAGELPQVVVGHFVSVYA